MSIYNKIYALLLTLPEKYVHSHIGGIQLVPLTVYIWILFYAIISNLLQVIFRQCCLGKTPQESEIASMISGYHSL